MSAEIESIIDDLLSEEANIFGVAIISKSGTIITQTENWNLNNDLETINELLGAKVELGQRGMTSLAIQGIKFMMVENTEERKIGTNITGKGHVIIAPIPVGGTGALVCYISPQAGPRDTLFAVQSNALKLVNFV